MTTPAPRGAYHGFVARYAGDKEAQNTLATRSAVTTQRQRVRFGSLGLWAYLSIFTALGLRDEFWAASA